MARLRLTADLCLSVAGLLVIPVSYTHLDVYKRQGEDIAQTIIKEVLEVPREKPNIERILRIDTSVKETSWRIIDGKVIIEGVIELQTLYVAQTPEGDQPVHHMSHRVKFTLFVEMVPSKISSAAVAAFLFPCAIL